LRHDATLFGWICRLTESTNPFRAWRGRCFMSLWEKSLVSRFMSEAEIVRQLRLLRYGPDNRASVRGGRKIPLKRLAEMAGLHRATLYRAIFEGRISDKTRKALSRPLLMLQAKMSTGAVSRPPGPPQDKMVRSQDWNELSRCSTCGGWQFSPVLMNSTKWYFCDGCLPPSQYPALGARAAD
jgi:hypothetical protein